MDKEKVAKVFEKHILNGKVVKEYAFARGKECEIKDRIKNGGVLEGVEVLDETIPAIEDIPFFRLQEPRVMKNRAVIDANNINEYIARDGYKGVIKALKDMSSEDIIEEVLEAGIRGRGGAGFPTGLKWKFATKTPGDIKYVLCNADEGDPGAYMDRSVLEGDPHAIIEGMIIAAKAIGAHKGYIYCRAEYPLAVETLNKAINSARAYGLLGENILGTGFDFDLEVYEGAGAFVCTEKVLLIISASILLTELGKVLKTKVEIASLLGVMTIGFVIFEKMSNVGKRLATKFNKIWIFAEILLFVLVGAQVNINVAVNAGKVGIIVILIGLLGRSIGVIISLLCTELNWKERLFCIIAYIPKATVQAAMGAVPLSLGIESGDVILAISVLAILITAPLGAIGINFAARKLLYVDNRR
ncbi:cation:proton antiporter domain-containing protein [Clostridium cochlearium]|uniref:cation:proton antiporter domain-containing protein n=1 Tax=Clostridium cochlearium TaxID=1494 RepID=UPI001C0EB925|nr:cation:proton antiporter [Clostridium cochlearium]MBU5268351.1 cation:proton antiporter [Clostridium cochlearium]